jgi:hypothetical protein
VKNAFPSDYGRVALEDKSVLYGISLIEHALQDDDREHAYEIAELVCDRLRVLMPMTAAGDLFTGDVPGYTFEDGLLDFVQRCLDHDQETMMLQPIAEDEDARDAG